MTQLAPNAANLLLGKGKLYFDRFLDGTMTRTGEQDLGNCTTFETTTTDTIKEKYESMDGLGLLYGRANTQRKVELKITGDEFSVENVATAAMGTTASLVQTSGTVATGSEETFTTAAILGRWYPLAHRKVSTVIVKDSSATLVLNTDYQIDAERGRIYLMPTSPTIIAGDSVKASYAYAAVTLQYVQGGTSPKIEGFLRFVGDPVSGPIYEGEFWHLSINSNGAMGFIADDYGNWTLQAQLIADLINHPSEPYYRLINNGQK